MATAAEITRLASSHDALVDALDETHGSRLSKILDELEEKISKLESHRLDLPIEPSK